MSSENEQQIFIGIDQSFSGTGIVAINADGDMIDFKLVKSNKKDNIFDRAYAIAEGVLEFIATYPSALIAMEGLAYGGQGNATRDLAGLLFCICSHLKLVAKRHVHSFMSPGTVKKTATGNGNIKGKEAIILATPVDICKRFGESGARKTTGLADLVDAYWIAQALRNLSLNNNGS